VTARSIVLTLLLATPAIHAAADPSRKLISVEFKEINEKGYPVIELTNRTGKDIDDVRGSIVMEDLDGKRLFGTGQTDASPGLVFLGADETKEWVPYGLNRKPEMMERLRTRPDSVKFFFEARSMTYMDGTRAPPMG
jgi:hypothetical protein